MSILKNIFKYIFMFFIVAIIFFVAWFWVWKMTGSNEWELVIDEKDVKIYSMKPPGSSVKKYKGIVHYKYTLSHLVYGMIDDANLETCNEWLPSCIGHQSIEKWNSQNLSDSNLWTMKMPKYFKNREFLIDGFVTQDPDTKEVLIRFQANPNRIPLNDCCIRIEHFNNSWRYTPVGDGMLRIEFVRDADMESVLLNMLVNFDGHNGTKKFLTYNLPKMLDKDRLRNAKVEYIEEPTI